MKAVFLRDEEEFRFTQVEFEVMSSCPSRDNADIQRCTMRMLEEDEGKEINI